MHSRKSLEGLLIDTWWFGLTHRMNRRDFVDLAELRVRQGFNAVQLVVGVPPEVAPNHPEAASEVGVAWNLERRINDEYLELARSRIQRLNQLGLRVIVYGAWGMQIDWTDAAFMRQWWERLVGRLDDLNVVYCLTGESDLWAETPNLLLPDRSTDDLQRTLHSGVLGALWRSVGRKSARLIARLHPAVCGGARERRRQAWGSVLTALASRTRRPIIVHTSGRTNSHAAVAHQELLSAVTTQTGHDYTARPRIWQSPLRLLKSPEDRYINLEPWYEGIRESFGPEDQLFAYWVSMLSGACSHAYGAQGIWNVGDGRFLAHWGRQTFDEACWLETPDLLGESHRFFIETLGYDPHAQTLIESDADELLWVSRHGARGTLTFYPNVARILKVPRGEYLLPLHAARSYVPPPDGPLVLWRPGRE
ncbi:MAG: DUF4038 domain-containing protein [Thiotrichales bacterium]